MTYEVSMKYTAMAMQTAFLFHGTGGHPKENWFPWLKEELEKKGYVVVIPAFPNPETPTPEHWYPVIDALIDKVESNSLLVGHSLGGAIALRFLERITQPIHQAIIVAPTLGIPPIKYIEGDSPFLVGGFDWEKIRNNAEHFTVFHSDNDPFICIENGEECSKQLGIELTFIPNAGHFNAAAGYTRFPELLESLK